MRRIRKSQVATSPRTCAPAIQTLNFTLPYLHETQKVNARKRSPHIMRLLLAALAILLLASVVKASTYTDIAVSPPPSSCLTSWNAQGDSVCNPVQAALDSGTSYLRLNIASGTYFNKNWKGTTPSTALANGVLADLRDKHHIIIQAAPGATTRPKITFDGSGFLSVRNTQYLEVRGLDIEGPAGRITGEEASLNRRRRTGRDMTTGRLSGVCSTDECPSCSQSVCSSTQHCQWKTDHCEGKSLNYYNGNGIAFWTSSSGQSSHILIEDNIVSKCSGSGIRANKVDNMIIRNNLVFDNTWWTVAASSGVVFAESQGIGVNEISGNVSGVGGSGRGGGRGEGGKWEN